MQRIAIYQSVCLYTSSGAIAWWSKNQTTIALSKIEAEYVAIALAGKEWIQIKMILEELK